MERHSRGNLWAIVLAAGEGSRMAPLTRVLYGHELPKQFAALDGDRTLLQGTIDRIQALVPSERTVVVVSAAHEDLARVQLREYPGVEIVVQPLNLGTGPGILLPLAHVLARDPDADVAVFPSDHHVRRPDPFLDGVRRALRVSRGAGAGVALLGAAAERAAVDLGWIVRGEKIGEGADRGWAVHRFIEKPPEAMAMLLLGTGSLWNTMVIAGSAAALWDLGRQHLPRQVRGLEPYLAHVGRPDAARVLADVYREMLPADFSREVLQAANGLAVVPVVDSGWFDCGTPERLLEWLRASPELSSVLARLQNALARSEGRKPATTSPGRAAHAAA